MEPVSLLNRFRNTLNEYLIVITGRSIDDISNKDYFDNKFSISMFVILMLFLISTMFLCCVGTTYECCSPKAEKKRRRRKTGVSPGYDGPELAETRAL